jgi:Holliday junction resolvasome RuvABC endonuclease subunit
VDGPNVCPPLTGVVSFSSAGNHQGRFAHLYQRWLWNALTVYQPDFVAYEEPIATGGNLNKIIMLCGMALLTEGVCYTKDIRCELVHASRVRKHFLGNGNMPKPKVATMARCRQLGWDYRGDDNIADAMALWAYTKSKYVPNFRIETGPLFDRVEATRRAGA